MLCRLCAKYEVWLPLRLVIELQEYLINYKIHSILAIPISHNNLMTREPVVGSPKNIGNVLETIRIAMHRML